nr:immunoglobulin-like domain-containing protein [Pseudomonas sp. ICMP 460]
MPNTAPAVTTIADSIDTTTVTLTANNSVTEGGQITYTATLTNPAQTLDRHYHRYPDRK